MDNHEPLNICLLSYRSHPHCGGQGVYVKHIAQAIEKLGHNVDILSGPPYPELVNGNRLIRLPSLDLYNPDALFRVPTLRELSSIVNLFEWIDVSTMGFPEPFTFGVRAFQYLKKRRHTYDIVHDNQSLSYGVWAIKQKIPTIATIHHPITKDREIEIKAAPTSLKKMKHWRWYSFIGMQKRVARTFSHLLTVSSCARDDICKDFRMSPERFHIAPNGVDTDMFYPIPEVEREKNRIMVTNSADVPLKGLKYLLFAVKQISATRPVKLIVIGAPKKDSHIIQLVRDLGIGNQVTFTGRIEQSEFIRQYAKAAVVVIPSIYEGFGLPACEAMACGAPVISTVGGALPEVVGDAGLLVPTADADALAKAIETLLDHPHRAQILGEMGYKRVKAHFTWEKAAEKTVAAYRETIRDHRRF